MNFYRDSTWVLEYIEDQEKRGTRLSGSLQTLVLTACRKYKLKTNPRHIYALLDSCWKYKPYLEKVMKKSGILKDIPKKKGKPIYNERTLLLLCHDLLLSKHQRIQMGKHPIKEYVLKYKARLHSELVRLKLKLKVRDLNELVDSSEYSEDLPPVRWIRVNPLRAPGGNVDSILKELFEKFPTRVDRWQDLELGTIYKDEYVPYLYGIHPNEKITAHELYKTGKIIIQDRASCFPAHILNPGAEDIVIDACAAPGNKTTHISAYMYGNEVGNGNNLEDAEPRIYAFERDPTRAKVLKKMLATAGCSKLVRVNVGDFTQLATPEKFEDVTGFIVDPSCSGSGIFGRKYIDSLNKQNNKTNDAADGVVQEQEGGPTSGTLQERLSKLSSFQFQVVKHAMCFPKAKKIVYSTCSIYAEEDERVVIDLLLDKNMKSLGWRVADRKDVVPNWPRRGRVEEFEEVFRGDKEKCKALADGCIRVLPREDGGIGFFAVCFVRD